MNKELMDEIEEAVAVGESYLTVFDKHSLPYTESDIERYTSLAWDMREMVDELTRRPTVGALASEFAGLVRWSLTGEQMRAVLDHDHGNGTCKTHEFVDANQLMLDAMTNMNVEFDWSSSNADALVEYMSAAWDRAIENGWWVMHQVSETGHCEDCGGICLQVVRAYVEYERNGMVMGTATKTLAMLDHDDSEVATAARLGDTEYLAQLAVDRSHI